MADERAPAKVALDDIIETAANGALRALAARSRDAKGMPSDGYSVDLFIRVGYPRVTDLPGVGGRVPSVKDSH
jgi:hypothetical protein